MSIKTKGILSFILISTLFIGNSYAGDGKIIIETLENTKRATWVVAISKDWGEGSERFKKTPYPNGTGFFISEDGYFITAYHVIEGAERIYVTQEPARQSKIKLIKTWENYDLALLKADSDDFKFPYLEIEFSKIKDGTLVYSHGYPLPEMRYDKIPATATTEKIGENGEIEKIGEATTVGVYLPNVKFFPFTTSLIVASNEGFRGSTEKPKMDIYVVDKALNPGNSGGPIIVQGTGKVISVLVNFKLFYLYNQGFPSSYSNTISLTNIKSELEKYIK